MIIINRIKLEVLTTDNTEDKYGFDYKFDKGLNIIAGLNSKGKTTINTCIYYALGMEELLGGLNDKAMDKSLKNNFNTFNETEDEQLDHNVQISKIFLEINNETEAKTIVRYIKYDVDENDNRNLFIYDDKIDSINQDSIKGKFYIRGNRNNEDINGFYKWLANFIGIELPRVSNSSRKDDYSPLYLQTIFSAIFIEQTKGWSDFFASMPYFGITRAKEKVVEFILNLGQLKVSTEKDVYTKKNIEIQKEWDEVIKKLNLLTQQHDGTLSDFTKEVTKEIDSTKNIKVLFKHKEGEEITLTTLLRQKIRDLKEIKNKPLKKVEETKKETLEKYQTEKKEYRELTNSFQKFNNGLIFEKKQLDNLSKQQNKITQEIKEHKSLSKVFDNSIINKNGGNTCPTCTQKIDLDLLSTKDISIPKLSLDENVAFLVSQNKLIESSIKSSIKVIKEKENLQKYYIDTIRKKEELLKALSKDLIADDRDFSEADTLARVNLRKEISNLLYLRNELRKAKESLKNLSIRYHNLTSDFDEIQKQTSGDDNKITNFEKSYKAFLFDFGYESNPKYNIKIWKKQPFKYIPVYQQHKDSIPQSIRVNSSASDFVRNLWSYSISLMENGTNHPGLIMLDEPGQHRTNIKSLRSLIKQCSKIKDKQIIIFTSIDKKLNNDEIIDLDVLLKDTNKEDFKLIKLDDKHKVIQKMK